MKYLLCLTIIALVFANSSHLVEIAKRVNSMKTTWKANEKAPERNYTQYLGVLQGGEQVEMISIPVADDLPEEFDATVQWPECPSLKEIRDQSSCGSCWAFAAVEAATDRLCIASNGKIQDRLSEEDLLSCCTGCGFGCYGGWPNSAWIWFHNQGVTTGGGYDSKEWCNSYSFPKCQHHNTGPYPPCGDTPETPQCVEKCQDGYPITYENDKHFFSTPYCLPAGNIKMLKTDLMKYGPMEVTFIVYEDFLTYQSGIYHHIEGEQLGGHAVKLVGWGVENGVEYWKLANSWNETWGEDGFFRIVLGKNECGIEGSNVSAHPIL